MSPPAPRSPRSRRSPGGRSPKQAARHAAAPTRTSDADDEQRLCPCGARAANAAPIWPGCRNELLDLQTQTGRFALDSAVCLGHEGGDTPKPRQGVLEQLKSLTGQLAGQVAEAGHVSAGASQAPDEARWAAARSGVAKAAESEISRKRQRSMPHREPD